MRRGAGAPAQNLSSFRAVVENAAVPLLPHGKAQAAEIAGRLGMSQRTFARRLSLEGVTFSEVLESLKSYLAQRYLADESLSISQIAWLLGYQEVSAFTHAFKRWTGRTPREVAVSADDVNRPRAAATLPSIDKPRPFWVLGRKLNERRPSLHK